VEVRVGSGSWQTATGTDLWSADVTLAQGENTIYARANDTSGNSNVTSITVTYSPPDEELPTIIISSPSDGETVTLSLITVTGSVSDNDGFDSVEVRVGTGSWQTATGTDLWSADVTLAEGPNTIYAMANDTSGNSNVTSITVTYSPPDEELPTIIISSPSDGDSVTSSLITVSGSASDNDGLATVEVRVGSGSWQAATGTDLWSADITLAEGLNMIYARANDTSGNSNVTSITVTYSPLTGSISGYKINDTNGNGKWDAGEKGLSDWNIRLTGYIGTGRDKEIIRKETTSDAQGLYMLDNLPQGRYIIMEKHQKGFVPTSPPVKFVVLGAGENIMNNNFTNMPIRRLIRRKR